MHETVKQMITEAGSQEGRAKIFALRDHFAATAMQGILASCGMPSSYQDIDTKAEIAYRAADAMLIAREE